MIKHIRNKSYQHEYLEALNSRTQLPFSQQQYFLNLKKGHEGEKQFDDIVDQYIDEKSLIIKDLLISHNGSTAQIDTLIVSGRTFYLYEIKNYEGEYLKLPGQLKKLKGQELICPSIQLERTKKVLQQMLKQWTENFEIKAFVVFIHPSFLLYEADPSDPFIFLGQLRQHLSDLKKNQSKVSKECSTIVNKLTSEQISDRRFRETSQDYLYEEMKKGTTCRECRSFTLKLTQRQGRCTNCGYVSSINDILSDHVDEITMLFPNKKLSPAVIHDWLKGQITVRRIRTYLRQNSPH